MVELELRQELVKQRRRINEMRAPTYIGVGSGLVGAALTSLVYQVALNPDIKSWTLILTSLLVVSGTALIRIGLSSLKPREDSRG